MGKELREAPRVTFESEIILIVGGKKYGPGQAKDISLGGIFVAVKAKCSKGEDCTVHIRTPESSLKIPGMVRRVTPNGVGIQFTEIDSDAFNLLNELMEEAEEVDY